MKLTEQQIKDGCYFLDENGQVYISSPEFDYTFTILGLVMVFSLFVPGMMLCLTFGGM